MKSFKSSSKKRILLIASLLLIAAALISGLTITAVAGKSQEPQAAQSEITIFPSPTPISTQATAVAGKSQETQTTKSEILDPPPAFPTPVLLPPRDNTRTMSDFQIVYFAGPETRGTEVYIAGKNINLPEDAELAGITYIDNSFMLNIVRGNSTIRIGCKTGKVASGIIAKGEEGAFDFLKQYFPDQAEAIDSLPVRASEEASK